MAKLLTLAQTAPELLAVLVLETALVVMLAAVPLTLEALKHRRARKRVLERLQELNQPLLPLPPRPNLLHRPVSMMSSSD
jgi:hypothetical protein